jgi:hypothetical protein
LNWLEIVSGIDHIEKRETLSNWNKNVNVHWYGNLNKLIVLGVILSVPVLGFGIYLWSKYLAARIVVWVVVGLVGIGLFSMLLRWTKRTTGIGSHSHPPHHTHENHHTHHNNHNTYHNPHNHGSHHKHKHH